MLPTHARHVLLCLRYGIGDVVMELPVIRRLREALPEARLTALGAPPAWELLDGTGLVDRVVSISRWGITHRWHGADPDTTAAIGRWVEREDFDLLLDVDHAPTAVREAVDRRGIPWLQADPRSERRAIGAGGDGVRAIAESTAAGWGIEVDPSAVPIVEPRAADHAFARAFLAERGLTGRRPWAVAPVASSRLKRWPLERFARVADELARSGPVLLVHGPECDAGHEVRRRMRRPEAAVPVGPLHLLRTAALLARCRGLLSNDTGVMHLAAAVGTPTVAVFGATRAGLFAPPVPHARAVEPAVDCGYRMTDSLHPPLCWAEGRCLIAERGCVEEVSLDAVLEAVRSTDAEEPPRAGPAA